MINKGSKEIERIKNNILILRKDIRKLMIENLDYPPNTNIKKIQELVFLNEPIDFLRKKWVLEILWVLETYKRLHFNAIKREIKGISSKALSDCLKEFKKAELISRTVEDSRPPKTLYELSEKGVLFVELFVMIILFLKDII